MYNSILPIGRTGSCGGTTTDIPTLEDCRWGEAREREGAHQSRQQNPEGHASRLWDAGEADSAASVLLPQTGIPVPVWSVPQAHSEDILKRFYWNCIEVAGCLITL
jgi:hypothetical protein